MHVKIEVEGDTYYTCPLNAIMLRRKVYSTNIEHSVCIDKGFSDSTFRLTITITPQEYARLENAIKKANLLECGDINAKAGKEIISPRLINAIMGLEVSE